ncbi:MAG: protecting protein DprA [Bryobacterales bacterium]|jgi:DNA processing protein|nr:protecting protein DprA [Bryobacterales bacterium]
MPGLLTRETELHWLALRMTPGLGTRTAIQLINMFKTPQAVFRASRSELEAAGLSQGLAQSIASGCAFDDAVTQQQKLAEAGAEVVPLTDPRYPARLKEIFDPPALLFARGRVELLGELTLGIVGTRRPSAYGTAVAARLAKDLTMAGLAIASGMARGIDTAAHRAALEVGLEAGGGTIAVFGCGVDEVYPAENRKLAEQIGRDGLIVSEFPMATPPYPQNFPIRNRIIAGMSVGVLVIEGGEYSGSAITAKLAAEQNREVFAVPGNITSKMSWGPNLLIKQGAKLVQEWNDVVVELQADDRRRLVDRCRNQLNLKDNGGNESKDPIQSSLTFGAGGTGRALLNQLKPDAPITLDFLVETLAGTSPSEIIAALFELELAGLVRQLPGKSFIKVWAD